MKNFGISLRLLLTLSLLLGLVYPLVLTGFAQLFFRRAAEGSLVKDEQKTIGSNLIAQKFSRPGYFWSRPSAIDFNTLASGGSNLGQASTSLKQQVNERRVALLNAHPGGGAIPQDLLFASGSGLDPDLSVPAAKFQAERVARARGLDLQRVQALIDMSLENRQFGFLGEPRVNVLKLNLALDRGQIP